MKTVKIIISLLAVLLFCAVLTACAEEDKEQPKQNVVQNAAVTEKEPVETPAVDDQDERDRRARESDKNTDSEDDRLGPGDKPSDGQDERDREARARDDQAKQERERREQEERERREQEERERREQERREQEQQQQSNGYEHHIGDAVFYTEHDLWKYVIPNENDPVHKWLDLEAMLCDVWGDVGLLGGGDGYFGADGGPTTRAVAFYNNGKDFVPGVGYTVMDYAFMVGKDNDGKQCDSVVRIYNEKQPPGGWIVIKGFSFGLSPDAAALLLYVLEQNELSPRGNIAGELSLPGNYECGYH